MRHLRITVVIAATISALALPGGSSFAAIQSGAAAAQVTQVPCGKALSTVHPTDKSTVELKRGCAYPGPLTISANGVTVTAYGSGPAPSITLKQDGATVDIDGSGNEVENLSLTGVAPGTWNCGGKKTPAGHVDGVDIEAGALDNTITDITATGFYAGVYVMAGSTGNLIENSTFTNNTELNTNDASGSSGAFGILLWGDSNTIQDNVISGSQACSIAYGYDGSAVEVYGGSYNLVDGNQATNDNAFTELGSYSGATASGNTYQSNTVSDGAAGLGTTFLVTRGSLDPDGPVYNTIVTDNTVNLTKSVDEGAVSYAWAPGDGTLLTLTGNYLNLGSNEVLYEDGGYVNGGGNTFIGTCTPSSDC
jgi:Right handed beta helix region